MRGILSVLGFLDQVEDDAGHRIGDKFGTAAGSGRSATYVSSPSSVMIKSPPPTGISGPTSMVVGPVLAAAPPMELEFWVQLASTSAEGLAALGIIDNEDALRYGR